MSQLDLWLDHYDDIYSDFDSRHYLKRRISEDFLYELKTAFAYKDGRIESLLLQLPADKRNEEQERMVIESLTGFFQTQWQRKKEEYRTKKITGLLLLVAGVIVMVANVLINRPSSPSFLLQSLRVLLEPAGWFLLWTAMDSLFYGLRKLKNDRDFFRELSLAKWHFKSL